jgi:hypothetical protein
MSDWFISHIATGVPIATAIGAARLMGRAVDWGKLRRTEVIREPSGITEQPKPFIARCGPYPIQPRFEAEAWRKELAAQPCE